MAMRIVAFCILLGLGAFVWVQRGNVNNSDSVPANADGSPAVNQSLDTTDKHPPFYNPDVEGDKPDEDPELDVTCELTYEGPRAVLNFTVTERHGWYVDHIYVEFWYVEEDENGELRQIGDPVQHLCKKYLDFDDTLRDNTTLLDVEFEELDGFGTTENWRVRVADYNVYLAPKSEG